jgi:hypothetical protein
MPTDKLTPAQRAFMIALRDGRDMRVSGASQSRMLRTLMNEQRFVTYGGPDDATNYVLTTVGRAALAQQEKPNA